MKALPSKVKNIILEKYQAGEKVVVIAREFGINSATVSKLARKANIKKRQVSDVVKLVALKLYQAGMSAERIANKLNLNDLTGGTVIFWKNRAGISKPPRRKTINCEYCGKSFSVKMVRVTGGPGTHIARYCSRICVGKSNKKPEEQKADKVRLAQWSKRILTKDSFACVRCGEKNREILQAHHKEYKSKNPSRMYDSENGETLCIACHYEEHKNECEGNLLLWKLNNSKIA